MSSYLLASTVAASMQGYTYPSQHQPAAEVGPGDPMEIYLAFLQQEINNSKYTSPPLYQHNSTPPGQQHKPDSITTPASPQLSSGLSNRQQSTQGGGRTMTADDEKLLKLKDVDNLSWKVIHKRFDYKVKIPALQMRYYRLKRGRDQGNKRRRDQGNKRRRDQGNKRRRDQGKNKPLPSLPLPPRPPPVL